VTDGLKTVGIVAPGWGLHYDHLMFWQRLLVLFRLLLSSIVLVAVIAPEWPAFQAEQHQLSVAVRNNRFDFLVWETNALLTKASAGLAGSHTYLSEQTRQEVVLEYLALVNRVRHLEWQIGNIFADPNVADPQAESLAWQTELAEQRVAMARLQPLAEAIVQEQVADVLLDQGFGILGQVWPPVQMHMTPLPMVLIVSPREEIRRLYGVPLVHGLALPEYEAMESAVFEQMDRSGLVVPIGGLGIFPAMILETGDINYLADVVAHEWAHHWLTLKPLGIRYAENPTMHTINETVANILGKEVGVLVVNRYYPELAPPPAAPADPVAPAEPVTPADPAEPPRFDFRAEMATTRITVDTLLAAGEVTEAEAYMEERRRFFWENGYRFRKLNQAYFAFYGAYADSPGATGADPIGPTLLRLWQQSPSLRVFMDQVAAITSLEDLQQLAAVAGIPFE
jgi:hypothetical protein